MIKIKLPCIVLFIALFTYSCGPSEGDIYENLLNRERIEILSTGDCQEMEERYKRINDAIEKESDQSRLQLNQAGLYRPIANHAENAPEGSECFSYESFERSRSGGRVIEGTIINIELLSELKEDYEKIN